MRKALPWIYLLLAVLGAILPWRANLEFIAESGGPVSYTHLTLPTSG